MSDFNDFLICPTISSVASRKDVALARTFSFKSGARWTGVPIIAANMQHIGTIPVARKLQEYGMLTALVKGIPSKPDILDNTFETFGLSGGVNPWVSANLICLDVANGYLTQFHTLVAQYRKVYPHAVIMAGNVVTPSGVLDLIDAGADIIKVGLGSGAACVTRTKTGVGYPQLKAIMACRWVAEEHGVFLCSDGGHTTPGDIAKSFVAGADFVMLGSMFCGTDLTGTMLYGSASKEAKIGVDSSAYYKTHEGIALQVPHKGTLDDVVKDILGGLRSTCSYVGARKIEDLKNAWFVS